ncbi:MAG: hypothetical protein K2Q34_06735 [Alphaproteobacteria bacterium]|nr:hypothetical protein [Alphaproteobacteria bacterium]
MLRLGIILLALTNALQAVEDLLGFPPTEELYGFRTRTGALNFYQKAIYDDALQFANPGREFQKICDKGDEVAIAGLLEVFPLCQVYGCTGALLEPVPHLNQDLANQLPAIIAFLATKRAEQDFIKSSAQSSLEKTRMFWALSASQLSWHSLHIRWRFARYEYERYQLELPAEDCYNPSSPRAEE